MKLRIDVTQKCIDRGERGSSGYCMVALAAREAGLEDALVGNKITYYKGGTTHTIELEEEIKAEITAFDSGKDVQPFSFEVEIP